MSTLSSYYQGHWDLFNLRESTMSLSSKLVLVIILLLIALCSSYAQDKSALKYVEEVNFEVIISYLSGDKDDYKSLLLFESGILSEVMRMLKAASIQVNEKIEFPKLFLKVTADHNLNNKSSAEEGWYYVTSEIYLIDIVKIKEHPSIITESITWQGDWTKAFVSDKNIGNINNQHMAEIVKSFINDYLEVNSN
jgi:hypothetical protein